MSLEVDSFRKEVRCDYCMNSRLIISENGYHTICTLSQGKACNCIMGRADHFKKKINFKNESVFKMGFRKNYIVMPRAAPHYWWLKHFYKIFSEQLKIEELREPKHYGTNSDRIIFDNFLGMPDFPIIKEVDI